MCSEEWSWLSELTDIWNGRIYGQTHTNGRRKWTIEHFRSEAISSEFFVRPSVKAFNLLILRSSVICDFLLNKCVVFYKLSIILRLYMRFDSELIQFLSLKIFNLRQRDTNRIKSSISFEFPSFATIRKE